VLITTSGITHSFVEVVVAGLASSLIPPKPKAADDEPAFPVYLKLDIG
jgi:hypothetical protein